MFFKEMSDAITLEFDLPEIDEEMEALIDERLDEMILGFKKKIPMIDMFLSKLKEDELKQFAKGELMQVIPAIKHKYLSGNRAFESQFSQKANQLATRLWNLVYKRLLIISICVGVILGILEVYLLPLISVFPREYLL